MPVGADGWVNLFNNYGNVRLVADLTGSYTTPHALWFNPVSPRRVLDTKTVREPLHDGTTRAVPLRDVVPPEATAVVLNMTAAPPTRRTYLSVSPDAFRPSSTSSPWLREFQRSTVLW